MGLKCYFTTEIINHLVPGIADRRVHVCGPPPMMDAMATQLTEWGVPDKDIHTEAFGPASVKRVGKPELPGGATDESIKVEFTRSGKSLEWTPDDGTLLELAEANGVHINFGCRAGNCNTCLTAVKDGKVAYINPPATPLAQGSALVCIALPDGEVTLDA